MPFVLTTSAQIQCVHGGKVTLAPTPPTVAIDGAAVLCEPDLVGAPIVGCPVPVTPAGTKPCTTIVSTLPGSTAPTVTAGGRPVYTSALSGLTDGVPPGSLRVASPGQFKVQA